MIDTLAFITGSLIALVSYWTGFRMSERAARERQHKDAVRERMRLFGGRER